MATLTITTTTTTTNLSMLLSLVIVLLMTFNEHVAYGFVPRNHRHATTTGNTNDFSKRSDNKNNNNKKNGMMLFSSPNDNNNNENIIDTKNNINISKNVVVASTDESPPRGEFLRGFLQSDSWSSTVVVQSVIIAKADLPPLGIFMDQSYQVQKIYLQGINEETQMVEKIPLEALIEDPTAISSFSSGGKSYTQYLELYSPLYHNNDRFGGKPVKVTPEEIGLVNLRTEVMDSVMFALPMVGFWTGLSWTFAKLYNDRYGGDFMDALFGR